MSRSMWIFVVFAAGVVMPESSGLFAGGHPFRTLVVVNRDSDLSLELGRYYAVQRGIPEINICPIFTTNRNSMSTQAFSNEVEGVVNSYIQSNGLSNQIDVVVFSMDIPHRVVQEPAADFRYASLTASFYYGFLSSPDAFTAGCDLAAGSKSDYFESERFFSRASAPSSNRYYLSAMLTASNLANGLRLIDRSVAADYSSPSARVILSRTSDTARNVQWYEFENTLYLYRFIDTLQERFWVDLDSISSQTNLFGVTAGRISHNWIANNTILPGAYAEHLTSFGGYLFEPKPQPTQMSILDWIYHGFSGSYGTVVEPCAYTNKYPSPRIHYWYARGFSLGESLWMSVQNPYQGVFVGDPLCAPYAVPPDVLWVGVSNGMVVSNQFSITGLVTAASDERPVSLVEWWRSGIWQGVVTQAGPQPGNQIEAIINGTSRVYTVQSGDDVYAVAAGLAEVLNDSPSLGIDARAFGDRVEIKQSVPGISAEGWTVDVSTTSGTALVATVRAWISPGGFVETAVAAREALQIGGASRSGDVVRATITRLDGGVLTNEVVVAADFTPPLTILNTLSTAINADTNLQSSLGCLAKYSRSFKSSATVTNAELWLFSRTNTWEGHNLAVDFQVIAQTNSTLDEGDSFTDNFNDNVDNLTARATIFLANGVTQFMPVLKVDTDGWPDGPHEIALTARDGTGVGTEAGARLRVQVKNHDLECHIVVPATHTYSFKSGVMTVDVASATSMSVTQIILYAEGKSVSTGLTDSLSAEISLDHYGAGPLVLQAKAWDDGNRQALSAAVTVWLYTDGDGDGLSDQWEYRHFGSITNYNGAADPDGDGYTNYEEFIADTVPTNAASYLAVQEINDDISIRFISSTNRRYQIRLNDGVLENDGNWYTAGSAFDGDGGIMTWVDATTNAPPATNSFRFYAIEPTLR